MKQYFYIAHHCNFTIRNKSSSGGVFSAITDKWFSVNSDEAVAYGCVLDNHMTAKHVRATKAEHCAPMRGSKYIESDMTGVMQMVEKDLREGKRVLFSGTPCQVAGVKAYLQTKKVNERGNLLTVDFVCHGVASPQYFRDYIVSYEVRYSSKLKSCSFRGKSRKGKRQEMVMIFQNGKKYISPAARYDEFFAAYSKRFIIRPSCFACKYAMLNRISDITLGDCWTDAAGDETVRSSVIINTWRGKMWFEWASEELLFEEVECEKIAQPQLFEPTKKPAQYDEFWQDYEQKGYHFVQKKYGNGSLLGRTKRLLARIAYTLYILEICRCIGVQMRRNRRK